jgi:hypothetical protein
MKLDMRAVVVLLIFVLFGWGYYNSPADETIKGALIAAFSGAWGFYLGSNVSSKEIRDQASVATEQARDATKLAREVIVQDRPQPVVVTNAPDEPVPVANEAKADDEAGLPEYARARP